MRQSLRITFRGMEPSRALEDRILELTSRLETFCDDITGCHVVIEELSRKHRHGNPFHVRVSLHGAKRDIVGECERATPRNVKSAFEALDEAFARAERQLQRRVDLLQMHH